MNTRFTKIAVVALLSAAGLLVVPASFAATQPGSITKFTAKRTHDTFTVKSKGWRDPAFGDMGWTHFSDWGKLALKAGQTATIKLVSESVGIHPGVTVWLRGRDDTAPDTFVVDHFYPQNANFVKFGAVDEGSGLDIGNIVMRNVAYGYDQDNNAEVISGLNGITDDVPGQLELTFTAKKNGAYMFVVGGVSPDGGVDSKPIYNIDVTVTVK